MIERLTPRRVARGLKRRAALLAGRLGKWGRALRDRTRGLPPTTAGWVSAAVLANLLRKDDPTIIEIGANEGQHTLWFLDAFRRPTIFCFEPEPRAVARFRAGIGSRANVHLWEIALSDRDGQATFHRSDGSKRDGTVPDLEEGWDHSGSLRRPKRHLTAHPWVKFERTISVPTRTLDSWARENGVGTVDLIWMDVQGAERDVIRGATEVLGRTRYLFTEYSQEEMFEGQPDLSRLLADLPSFRVVARFEEDVLLENTVLCSGSPRSDLRVAHGAAVESRSCPP